MKVIGAIGTVGAVGAVAAAAAGSRDWQRYTKPIVAPALAVESARDGAPELVLPLIAAMVGDVILLDPDDDRRLVAGAAAFAFMQLRYAHLLWRLGARGTVTAFAPRLVGWVGGAALLVQRKEWALVLPLMAYGSTLALATGLASDPRLSPESKQVAGVVIPSSDRRSWLGLGALLFTISDALILIRRIFIRRERASKASEAAILATYFGAQFLLVNGITGLSKSLSGDLDFRPTLAL